MKKKYSKVSTCLAAITSSLVAGAAVTGCIPAVEYGTPHADFSVKTKVIDEEGKAIEGIQVALKSSLGEEPIAVVQGHGASSGTENRPQPDCAGSVHQHR